MQAVYGVELSILIIWYTYFILQTMSSDMHTRIKHLMPKQMHYESNLELTPTSTRGFSALGERLATRRFLKPCTVMNVSIMTKSRPIKATTREIR